MTKEEYLQELASYLKKLPKADFEDSMAYFTELFDEAGPEGQKDLIKSLGSPQEAAREATGQLLDQKIELANSHKDKVNLIWFSIMAIMAAPVGLAVLILLASIVLTIGLLAFSLLLLVFVFAGVGLILSVTFLWETIMHFQTWGLFWLNLAGLFMSLSLGILLSIGGLYLSKFLGNTLVNLAKQLYRKVAKHG